MSDALVSQVDFLASLSALVQQVVPPNAGLDSQDHLPTLLGQSDQGREWIIGQAASGTLSLIQKQWKYIEPSQAAAYNENTDIELGNAPQVQLYNLENDEGEVHNVAEQHPEIVQRMETILQRQNEAK